MASAARLDIRSAQDIIAALGAADLATRLALCQAAAAHPAHILAYGAAAGVDLVLAFLNAARRRESLLFRKASLAALVNFDDPRVVELFREVLQTSSESDVLRLAAKRVALDPSPESREFLRDRLLNEHSALRVRCIAGVLTPAPDLSEAERLRLLLAGTGDASAAHCWPRDRHEAALSWAKELSGPFALRARRSLEGAANPVDFVALTPAWLRWADADRAWFLNWGGALFGTEVPPAAVCALLNRALNEGAKPTQLAALRWCGKSPSAVSVAALEPHTASTDTEIRLAALAAMPPQSLDWSALALSDREPSVRALAIERALSTSGPAQSRADLAALIEDADWRVRAAVVRGLNQSGALAVDSARDWLGHANPQVRAGALRLLLDHGQERWLVESLIG